MTPPVLSGTAGNARCDLAWSAVAGAVKYRLRRAIGTAGYGALYTGPALSFAAIGLTNGTPYHWRVRGVDAKGNGGPWSNIVTLTPKAPPPSGLVVGWGSMTQGGNAEKAHPMVVRSFADLKAAVAVNAVRYVLLSASAVSVLDGLGDWLDITKPGLTIDGSEYHGQFKRMPLRIRVGSVVLNELRLRMGDQVKDVGEADVLNLNPVSGGNWGAVLRDVVVNHCSGLWSNDVVLAILNHVEYVTIQHSIIGAGLVYGTNPTSPNGYGANVTVINGNPQPNLDYGRKITFYRNFFPHNKRRNIKPERADLIDYVNNVVSGWYDPPGESNPRSANIEANYFKKSGASPASTKLWRPDNGIPAFPGSIYWDGNLARNRDGSPFTPTFEWGSMRSPSPLNGGPHNVTVEPMTDALAAEIVTAAGPTFTDATDAKLKADFRDGTGTFYNGQGYPPPNPSWA